MGNSHIQKEEEKEEPEKQSEERELESQEANQECDATEAKEVECSGEGAGASSAQCRVPPLLTEQWQCMAGELAPGSSVSLS